MKTEKILEEFDEFVKNVPVNHSNLYFDGLEGKIETALMASIKSFILQAIEQAKKEERERILEEIRKMKLPVPNPYGEWVKIEKYNNVMDLLIDVIRKN